MAESGANSNSADVGQMSKQTRANLGELPPKSAKVSRNRPTNLGRFRPKLSRSRPNSAKFGAEAGKFGPKAASIGSGSAEFGTLPTKLGPSSATFGQNWAGIHQSWAEFGRDWPNWGYNLAALGPKPVDIDRIDRQIGDFSARHFDQCPNATRFVPVSTEVGQSWAKLGQYLPGVDHYRSVADLVRIFAHVEPSWPNSGAIWPQSVEVGRW